MHDFVPGVMRCAKCKFHLIRTTLYLRSGNAGPGNNDTEPCPNGCGPLWPQTWKQEATELGERLEAMFSELAALKAAVRDMAEAAQNVIDRWHTPQWKDAAPTAESINRLSEAITKHAALIEAEGN